MVYSFCFVLYCIGLMAGEMAQLSEALAGLPEDPGLLLISTGPLTAVHSSSSRGFDALLWPAHVPDT